MQRIAVLTAVVCLIGLTISVRADVVITQKSSIQTMGMGTSIITSTQQIKGDRDHTRMLTRMGGMTALSAGGGQEMENIMINRLDKGVMWILTPQAKLFNEIEFAQLKTRTTGLPPEVDADEVGKYNWNFEISDPEESTINGFKCRGIKGVAVGISKEDTGQKTRIIYELWVGTDLPGGDEIVDYYNRLSEATGQDKMNHAEIAQQMFRDVGPQFSKLTKAMTELKGFPVKLVMSIESTSGMPGGSVDTDPQAMAMMKRAQSKMGDQKSEDGMQTIMSVNTELIGIEQTTLDDDLFEIPEGYSSGF